MDPINPQRKLAIVLVTVVVLVLLMLFSQDFGMWERGDKTNQGIPEINVSSIGMAKVN